MKRESYRVQAVAVLVTLAMMLCPPGLEAAIMGYLKIGDIQGESQRAEHEDEIDVHGVHWNIAQPAGALESGRTTTRAVVGPLTVRKFVDASSPYLALASMQGKSLPSVTLAVRRDSGEAHLDYLVITMTNVKVCSYEMLSNDGSEQIAEEVGFCFEKVTYKYVVQADDHSAGDEHEIEYDIAAGV